MKNKKIVILLIVIDIIIIAEIYNFISKNTNIKKEKQIIKEMSSSAQETELNNQINTLNTEHTEYMNYIQTCKTSIATALTNEGVPTSNEATLEKMAEKISNVLQARTKDATATADNITEGKTAYVNGKLIIGTGADNEQANNIKITGYSSEVTQSSNFEFPIGYRSNPYVFQEDYKYVIVSLAINGKANASSMPYSTISEGTYLGGCKDWNGWNGNLSVMIYEDVPKDASLYVYNCGSYAITFIKK